MARRNFIVVDDMPELAEKVERAIKQYYNSKSIYDYNTKTFLTDNHFDEANQYIQRYYRDIDIIFSDQNLRGGQGTDLFRIASKIIEVTDYTSVIKKAHIYKVMHSNIDARFKENQREHLVTYYHFVNSENEKDILSFLDYYEVEILAKKGKGNISYIENLYNKPKLKSLFENGENLKIDRQPLSPRDILFMVMDKEKSKSDYYHFFYKQNEVITKSVDSIKPSSSFNSAIDSLSFIEGTLLEGKKEKFKINPLWISSVDTSKSTIKLLSPNSLRYEIRFDKLEDNFNQFIDKTYTDEFFR